MAHYKKAGVMTSLKFSRRSLKFWLSFEFRLQGGLCIISDFLQMRKFHGNSKTKKPTSVCKEKFNRNMLLFEEKLEEAISSGMRSFHISKTKMPRRLRHGSLLRFHLPSGLTEIRAPQHNFWHLLFFLCLNIPPPKRKAITLVFLTEGVHRFVSCLPRNLAFKWNVKRNAKKGHY